MMNLPNYLKDIRQRGRRHFTLEELMSDLRLSKSAALTAIHRLKVHGDLISPARGLYVIVPPEHQLQGSIPPEDLVPILMSYLQADYYVALLSAAMYHGAAHQKPGRFQVISNRRVKHPLEFGQIKIELVYKKSLTGLPIKNVTVSTGYLKVATPELTVMDMLLYQAKSGGLNHIATVLSELIEVIDADKLVELAKISGAKAWVQRLGYILEKIESMEPDKAKSIINLLEQYLSDKMKIFIPLAPEITKINYPRIKKWMIIENTNFESDL